MTLKLVLGDNELDLTDWNTHGIIVSSIDLGFPTPREVVTDLPNQDGSYDETAYFGTRVVTLTGSFGPGTDGSRSVAMAKLSPFLAPSARPVLVYSLDSDTMDRQLTLRAADYSAPVSQGANANFTVSWKCPDPIAYGTMTNDAVIPPNNGTVGGRTYNPLTTGVRIYDRTYPSDIGGGGTAFVINNGDYISWPTFHIFGPCTNPKLYWLDSDNNRLATAIIFTGLTIADGDYLEVNTKYQTVRLNGESSANRYNNIDFVNTKWGPLQPGTNTIQFATSTASVPCLTYVFWQDASLV